MTARLVSVGLTATLFALAACSANQGATASSATTTAAGVGSPSRKTVDSAGFVDNAGQTSEERKQAMVSRRGPGRRERTAAASSYEAAALGAPGYTVVSKFARARCDRE